MQRLLEKHSGRVEDMCEEAGVSVSTLYRKIPGIIQRGKVPGAGRDTVKIATLLRFFGVRVARFQGFWEVNRSRLDEVHREAREGYLGMVRRLHPDTGGPWANEERLAQVNAAWGRLEGAFRKHGWEG